MAKKEKAKDKEKKKEGGEKGSWSLLSWLVLGTVILTCSGLGFGVSYIMASPKDTVAAEGDASEETALNENGESTEVKIYPSSTWHYNMSPLVATLDEPRASRYIRVGLTMELDFDPTEGPGEKLLKKNTPVLTNWLMIYLSSLSLENTQGGSNKKRMQMEILDSFNETLWPDAKPHIKQILFKEFAIQ